MTQPSPDARAVARAIDALTTQVRRLADALTTTPDAPSDDATTTDHDGRTLGHWFPISEERTQDHARLVHEWVDGQVAQARAAAEDAERTGRRDRYAAALYATLELSALRGPWATAGPLRRKVWYDRADAAMAVADEEQAALRAEVGQALKRAEAMEWAMESTTADALRHSGCHMKLMAQCQRAEQAEDDLERARRISVALENEVAGGTAEDAGPAPHLVRILIDRAARGALTPDEGAALRRRAEQIITGRETWKGRAERMERDYDCLTARYREERTRAEQAEDRAHRLAATCDAIERETDEPAARAAVARIRAALNGTTED